MCPSEMEFVKEIGKTKSSRVTLVRAPDGEYYAQKQIQKAMLQTEQQVQHVWGERRTLEHFNAAFPELHIPKLEATAQDDEYLYFFLTFLSGAPLHHHIQSDKGFGEQRCRVYTKQIARILQVLHSDGYAYRDLKASNILLTNGRCHLIDFGFCKKVGDPPLTSSPCGTLHALAPEVLKNFVQGSDEIQAYDAFRHDWWSLGVLSFEMMNMEGWG